MLICLYQFLSSLFTFIMLCYFFQCFDLGFCDCGPGMPSTEMPGDIPTETAKGMDLSDTSRCIIAPFIMAPNNDG